ncbi:MAG: terpene cyclase/mutase family protein [Verrucomicrobia bacterium]|nr:terpene cyclase/mutase family protein [Verrucomicrobiota bacterium]
MDPSLDSAPFAPPVPRRKLSFWARLGGGSLTFALIFHLVLLAIGAFWIFRVTQMPEKKVDFLPAGGNGGGERGAEYQVNRKKQRQITPATNVKRVFAEGAMATFSIPEQSDDFGQMSSLNSLTSGGMSGGLGGSGLGKGFGKGLGNGPGLGTGGGLGKLFGQLPDAMRKRCTKEDRLQRLAENGGTPACEEAVLKGLRWLKTHQNQDGSWDGPSKVAMTGLALLAYFGHCETPVSPEFGESCLRGITYLVNVGVQTDGCLADGIEPNRGNGNERTSEGRKPVKVTPNCYAHAIATYALGEATTFCKEIKQEVPSLLEVTEKAGQYIIDNQHRTSGGWDYNYDTYGPRGGDVSIVGWQLQALKACSHTAIEYKGMNSCIIRALAYLATCRAPNGGYGYAGPGSTDSCTGIGMLCHQMWGKGKSADVRKAADFVLTHLRFDFKRNSNLYAHYYLSQAMMQRGGNDWRKYNRLFRNELLRNQEKNGSWLPPTDAYTKGSPVFSTGLCTLMLEVYYRFLSTDEAADERPGI